jgi:hypothetical protein
MNLLEVYLRVLTMLTMLIGLVLQVVLLKGTILCIKPRLWEVLVMFGITYLLANLVP